jgi:hypothetical protein
MAGNLYLAYTSAFRVLFCTENQKDRNTRWLCCCFFGSGVTGIIFIFFKLGAKFDVELFSLLAMNATALLLNKLSVKKGI